MSNPGIFLIQENGGLLEMNEQAPPSENQLQAWLERYPSLLAGHQIDSDEPRRWLLIERECGVPSEQGGGERWAADHLFLDQDAIPTIVEVKRSINTEIRRKVVGQMLDYAANAIVYWPAPYIRERFAATCSANNIDPDTRLIEFLGESGDAAEFWEKANRNLQDGKIRLLFVADEIPTELQRIVEFLNGQMDRAEVLALEIKQFVGEGQTGLVPRVIGQTAEAIEKKTTTSEIGQIQLAFWTAFKDYMSGKSEIRCGKPAPQSWMDHTIGRPGVWLCSIASTWSSVTHRYDPELRVEFVMRDSNANAYFERLQSESPEIGKEIGQELFWHNPPDTKSCKVFVRQPANFRDSSNWTQHHEWLRQNLERFERVFGARVKGFDSAKATGRPA